MSNQTILVFAAVAVTIAGSMPAFAASPGDGKGGVKPQSFASSQRLKRLDADKDGAISKDEFVSPRAGKFKELDVNHDAAVDGAEIEAPMVERAEFRVKRLMKKLDSNSDSKISRDEFQNGPRERFKARDLNSDGKITEQDLPPGNKTSGGGWFGGGGGKADGKRGAGARGGPDTIEAVDAKSAADFAKIDANADGVIDLAEVQTEASERIAFSKKRMLHLLDADSDGRLTETEFTAKTVKRFSILDLNDDGRIARDDFASSSRGWQFGK
jgi:Ca2+-binding EF-hand superfamily protein